MSEEASSKLETTEADSAANIETDIAVKIEPENNEVPEIILVKHDTLPNLDKQRQNYSEMCDVILQVEDAEFPAHRLVLSASWDYFLKMFTVDMQEKHNKKVVIKSISPKAMIEILKSIYTNKILFTKQNISDILHGASLMLFPSIVHAAEKYIEQNIHIENCFWFRELVLVYSFADVKEAVINFFLIHFEEIFTHQTFLDFTFDELNKIFGSDDLLIGNEKNVFEVLVKWLNNNVESRKEDFFFNHVRLQFVPIDYIVDVIKNHKIFMQFDKSRRSVENVLMYRIRPSFQPGSEALKMFCY